MLKLLLRPTIFSAPTEDASEHPAAGAENDRSSARGDAATKSTPSPCSFAGLRRGSRSGLCRSFTPAPARNGDHLLPLGPLPVIFVGDMASVLAMTLFSILCSGDGDAAAPSRRLRSPRKTRKDSSRLNLLPTASLICLAVS